MKKRIVVIGAGYAGILTAKKLAKKAKKTEDVEITIIDKNPFHTMLTELHEVAAQRVDEDSIKISLKRVFAGRKVNVVMDTVTSVDYDKKVVVCETQSFPYDYAVLASGSKPTFFGVPGAQENAFTLWSFDDAVEIRDHITNVFRAAACETNEKKKRQLLTFFIVGAGFSGVEMAGELAELVPLLCDKYEIDPKFVRVSNVDVLDRPCMVLPPKLSEKVRKRLVKMNVDVMLKTNIVSVGEDFIEYNRDGKVTREQAETVIWTAGIEGSDIATASSGLGSAGRGRVQTDEYLRSQNKKDVYIAGDNIFYIPEGEKAPVPQMVENCEQCADIIAHNIWNDISGKGEKEKYKPAMHGAMVCIGGRYGTAHVGLPGKFFGLPSFLAMLSKHFINVIYFIQVLGWNKIFSYIKHEFFTVRNNRSFLGGHFSNKGATFFLVPFRIWLGVYWLYEGILKVIEGWFKTPMMQGFYQGTATWYDSIIWPEAFADAAASASGAADAVASASGAVEGAAAAASPLIFQFPLFNLIRLIFVNTGDDYAFRVQVGFVDWLMNSVIIPSDTLQMVFQIVIVCVEILVGLALIGGLFTTFAGGVSIILMTMFLTSTGIYMGSQWWMFFGGIAMLFGAGKVFSLDYYVMPWLKRKWKNVKWVKKWYLYHD